MHACVCVCVYVCIAQWMLLLLAAGLMALASQPAKHPTWLACAVPLQVSRQRMRIAKTASRSAKLYAAFEGSAAAVTNRHC